MLHTDHHFVMGTTHEVCQDYARSGPITGASDGSEEAYAIVSDGCSSSRDTDVGARLLVAGLELQFKLFWRMPPTMNILLHQAKEALGYIKTEALDATLLGAITDKGNTHIAMWGDGNVIWEDSHVIRAVMVSYEPNMPPYVSYQLDESRAREWQESAKPRRSIHTLTINKESGESEQTIVTSMGNVAEPYRITMPTPDQLLLGTDGVTSFTNNLAKERVVKELLATKSFTGRYVLRRLKRMLRELSKEGYDCADDIAVAGICRSE